MSLIIPIKIKNDINKYSGYITDDSIFAKKNLKGLFYTKENQIYLANELYSLITNKSYILDNLDDYDNNQSSVKRDGKVKTIIKAFINKKSFIDRIIFNLIKSHPIPFIEDLSILNPVQQLHSVNLDFLVKSSKNIIQSPQNLEININNINPDTYKYESVEYDYDPSSYNSGVWKPEDLFVNCKRNKENPYWIPLEVNIYSDPYATGTGHIYNDILYNGTNCKNISNKQCTNSTNYSNIKSNGKNVKNYSQFPGWQTTVNKRFYDRGVDGLRDGGLDDRRVQSPSGYNMYSLINKSY